MKFTAVSKEGKMIMNDWNGKMFRQHLKDNPNMRYQISPLLPESKKMRGYFEGCLVKMFAFIQENLDHRNSDDIDFARQYLKLHFAGEYKLIDGKQVVMAKSTLGRVSLAQIVEKTTDMLLQDYGCPSEALDPEQFKVWRDTVYPQGGPDNYIDFLIDIKILSRDNV